MALAIVFADSFDGYGTHYSGTGAFAQKWDGGGAGPCGIDPSYGRLGSGGIGLGISSDLRKLLPPMSACGAAFSASVSLAPEATTGYVLFALYDIDGNLLVYFRLNTNGAICAVKGALSAGNTGGTIIGTSAPSVVRSLAHTHIEAQVAVGAGGTVDIWVEGVSVLSVTGVTFPGGDVEIVRIGCNGRALTLTMDDFVVYDATARTIGERLGDVVVEADEVVGTGTGGVGTWAQTGGTAGQPHTAVDDAPADGDTSFVASDTPGDRIEFTVGGVALDTPAVKAVLVNTVFRKDDAGARSAANVLRSGSTLAVGAAVSCPADYIGRQEVFNTDPDTGAAWTVTGRNAIRVGSTVAA